jgi:hypothetical protein
MISFSEFKYAGRGTGDAIFVGFDFLGNTYDHVCKISCANLKNPKSLGEKKNARITATRAYLHLITKTQNSHPI